MDVPAQGESWVGREGEVERGGGVGRERERERLDEFLLSLLFSSFQTLKELGDAHVHWWGQILLMLSTDSSADLLQKHPHNHTQKQYFTSYLGIP